MKIIKQLSFVFFVSLAIWGCKPVDTKDKLAFTIQFLLEEIDKAKRNDKQLDMKDISDYVITKKEFSELATTDDFPYESYKDWKEDFLDELAGILSDAEDENVALNEIEAVMIKSDLDEDADIVEGTCEIVLKNKQTYILDFVAANQETQWKIILIEDLSIEEESQKTKPSNSQNSQTKQSNKIYTASEIVENLENEVIKDLLTGGRNYTHNMYRGDLNKDNKDDYLITYCIVATDDDRDAGGGNALSNMRCIHEGLCLYITTGEDLSVLHYDDDRYNNLKNQMHSSIGEAKVDGIYNGIIQFNVTGYKDDDSRCCPTDEKSVEMKYTSSGLKLK